LQRAGDVQLERYRSHGRWRTDHAMELHNSEDDTQQSARQNPRKKSAANPADQKDQGYDNAGAGCPDRGVVQVTERHEGCRVCRQKPAPLEPYEGDQESDTYGNSTLQRVWYRLDQRLSHPPNRHEKEHNTRDEYSTEGELPGKVH